MGALFTQSSPLLGMLGALQRNPQVAQQLAGAFGLGAAAPRAQKSAVPANTGLGQPTQTYLDYQKALTGITGQVGSQDWLNQVGGVYNQFNPLGYGQALDIWARQQIFPQMGSITPEQSTALGNYVSARDSWQAPVASAVAPLAAAIPKLPTIQPQPVQTGLGQAASTYVGMPTPQQRAQDANPFAPPKPPKNPFLL